MKYFIKTLLPLIVLFCFKSQAQVSYGSVAAYGLRKIVTTYTGNIIQVRRACDNATANIGFTSCGDLDTITLKSFVLAANPISAITATAAAAYSLRKLSCAYAGSAIAVRRSSDSFTTDIGFTANGDLDTTALKTFVGANNGFVLTWYDQSGNARNATQATNANQPRIVTAGAVLRQNNRPAISFAGSPILLTASALNGVNATSGGSITTVNIVFQSNNSVAGTILSNGDGGSNRYNMHTPWSDNNTYFDIGNNGAGGRINTSLTWSSLSIGTLRRNGAQGDIWKNGTNALSSGAMATNVTSTVALSIGGSAAYGSYMIGNISELIVFPSALSTTERQFMEWAQSQYYTISGPNLTTLPASAPSASVATWYDQTSSGAHASPTVSTNQPLILLNGIIQRNSTTIPAISFGGAQKGLVANRPVSAYPISLSAVASNSAVSTNGAFVKLGGLDNVNNTTAGVGVGIGNSGGSFDASGNSVIALKEWILWCPSSPNVTYPTTPFAVELTQLASGTMSVYLNGVNAPLSNASNTVGASITGSLYLGGYRNGSDRFPVVKETEVTVYSSALNDTRRILLNSNQAAYHNITITGTKYAPPAANSYHRFVLGIGRQSATDSVCSTRESAGMGFTCSTNAAAFLKDNGDYICAGMSCPTSTTSTLSLPGSIQLRWQDDWFIDKTDVGTTGGTVSIYFDFSDYSIATVPGIASNYSLLARPNTASNFTVVSTAIANVSGDRVYFTVDVNNITDIAYYTIGTTNPGASPLPIEMINFTAEACEKNVCLNWSTASEINNDYFSIERSEDAIDWRIIKKIKGAGTSDRNLNYSTIDDAPMQGINYYRLKQFDFDGRFKYSPIKLVTINTENEVSIYPNPNSGNLNISNCKAYNKLTLTDILGTTVYEAVLNGELVSLNMSRFKAGVYFIMLENTENAKKYSSKIILEKQQ